MSVSGAIKDFLPWLEPDRADQRDTLVYYPRWTRCDGCIVSFADLAKKKPFYNELAPCFDSLGSRAATAGAEVEFILQLCEQLTDRPRRLLDIACGAGRHAGELAQSGYAVTGIDTSSALLRIAARKAPTADFLRVDMRNFELRGSFDCAYSLWDSFAYMSLPSDWCLFRSSLALHLRPGGLLLLDAKNYRRQHEDWEISARKALSAFGPVTTVVSRRFFRHRTISEAVYLNCFESSTVSPAVVVDQTLSRVYSPGDVAALLGGDFSLVRVMGDFSLLSPYFPDDSERMILAFLYAPRALRADERVR